MPEEIIRNIANLETRNIDEDDFDKEKIELDENEKKLMRLILNEAAVSVTRVALCANIEKTKDPIEIAVQEFVSTLQNNQKDIFKNVIRANFSDDTWKRKHLGEFSKIDILKDNAYESIKKPTELIKNIVEKNKSAKHLSGISEYTHKILRFFITKIRCKEETGWDAFGADEIYIGGTAIDENGQTNVIHAKKMGNFDSGEWIYFNPDKQIEDFNITENGDSWPKHYYILLYMAEVDNGNFDDFCQKLTSAIRSKVHLAIANAVGSTGGVYGKIIANAVYLFLYYFVPWLLGDVIIDRQLHHLVIDSPKESSLGAGYRTTVKERCYKGGSGHYHVWSYWILTN